MVTRAFAVEDGNIDRATIVTARTVQFKDIDLTFEKNAVGDVFKKQHIAAVKQAVKNILMTNHYEKPFQWNYGANLVAQLFELAGPDVEFELENAIRSTVELYEPRATVQSIVFNTNIDANYIGITINFQVQNIEQLQTLDVTLTRRR